MKKFLIISIIAIISIILAVLSVLVFVLDKEKLLLYVSKQIRDYTGRMLVLQQSDIDLSLGAGLILSVKNVSLTNAEWASQPYMIEAGMFSAEIALLPLLKSEIAIDNITLHDSKFYIETHKKHGHNFIFTPLNKTLSSQETAPKNTNEASTTNDPQAIIVNQIELKNVLINYSDGSIAHKALLDQLKVHYKKDTYHYNIKAKIDEELLKAKGKLKYEKTFWNAESDIDFLESTVNIRSKLNHHNQQAQGRIEYSIPHIHRFSSMVALPKLPDISSKGFLDFQYKNNHLTITPSTMNIGQESLVIEGNITPKKADISVNIPVIELHNYHEFFDTKTHDDEKTSVSNTPNQEQMNPQNPQASSFSYDIILDTTIEDIRFKGKNIGSLHTIFEQNALKRMITIKKADHGKGSIDTMITQQAKKPDVYEIKGTINEYSTEVISYLINNNYMIYGTIHGDFSVDILNKATTAFPQGYTRLKAKNLVGKAEFLNKLKNIPLLNNFVPKSNLINGCIILEGMIESNNYHVQNALISTDIGYADIKGRIDLGSMMSYLKAAINSPFYKGEISLNDNILNPSMLLDKTKVSVGNVLGGLLSSTLQQKPSCS